MAIGAGPDTSSRRYVDPAGISKFWITQTALAEYACVDCVRTTPSTSNCQNALTVVPADARMASTLGSLSVLLYVVASTLLPVASCHVLGSSTYPGNSTELSAFTRITSVIGAPALPRDNLNAPSSKLRQWKLFEAVPDLPIWRLANFTRLMPKPSQLDANWQV